LENDFDIKNLTSLKIGGKIKTIYFPTSVDEFVEILKSEPTAKVLGNMSNTLISSSGYNGVIICTTEMTAAKNEFTKSEHDFFGSRQAFKRNTLKAIRKKLLQKIEYP